MKKRKVLLIGPHGIGNLIMARPAIQGLLEQDDLEVSLGCLLSSTEWMARKLEDFTPGLKHVYALHTSHGTKALLNALWQIRRESFDLSIVLFPSAKIHYNFLNRVLGASKKVGSLYHDQPFEQGAWLNGIKIPVKPAIHDTEQMIHLVEEALKIKLSTSDGYHFRNPEKKKNLIGIHPGCKAKDQHKRWGNPNFVKTAQLLLEQNPDLEFRFFFGPDEMDDLREFKAIMQLDRYAHLNDATEVMDQLNLTQLFDHIAECEGFISNDSGPMHMAAAQGCKTVAVIGPSDESRTGPLGEKVKVVSHPIECRPCTHTLNAKEYGFKCTQTEQFCLTKVDPPQVTQTLMDLLKSQ